MTITEQILAHKHANEVFTVYLNDGRRFLIPHGDYVSTHPSGKGTNLIVYGEDEYGENEEHFVPVSAVSSISIKSTT